MAINFPTSPSVNDTHTDGDMSWKWDGSSWEAVFETNIPIPSQSGQTGEFLTTDGTTMSWEAVVTDPAMGGDMTGTASNAQLAAGAVGSSEIAAGAVGGTEIASTFDISSKTVTLPAASVTAHVTQFDDNQLKEEIALLGFRVASNGSLAKYNLVDQTVDAFEDASGIDTSASTYALLTGGYYSGAGDSVTVSSTGSSSSSTYTYGGVGYTYYTFTGNGNFVTSATKSFDFMLIAGGGGGGEGSAPGTGEGGGGGAGGLKYYVGRSVGAGTHAVVVGAGGAGGTGNTDKGDDGIATTFTASGQAALSATAGGGGGSRNTEVMVGNDGGSGGGGGQRDNSNANNGSGTANEGNNGGSGYEGAQMSGGGGGGAMSAGTNAPSTGVGGAGGTALTEGTSTAYDWENSTAGVVVRINGTGSLYAGGGGGAGQSTPANGGGGGAGNGATSTGGGGNATANTGSGGGGMGGNGGSGIAVIRYVTSSLSGVNDMTLVSTTTTAQATPTKADLVMTYTNGAGTATVNTDLKAYASRDDGTTWTQLTLASQGSTGAHTILSAHDLDISGQPSGTAMRYKITTHNQSVTKETRIHAVSLGWS